MHIYSVTISNFRCFGPNPETVLLGPDVNALIGANGSGKSAFLAALRKLFGATQEDRTFKRSDFHVEPGDHSAPPTRKEAVIEVVFAFPELEGDEPEVKAAAERTVPAAFRHMTISGVGGELRARIRLEALWEAGESFEDEVTTKLFWLTTNEDVPFGSEDEAALDKVAVTAGERARIQMRFVPATRDTLAVTRNVLRQLLARMERHGSWDNEIEGKATEANEAAQTIIDELPSANWVLATLQRHWAKLHDFEHLREPTLRVDTREMLTLVRSLTLKVGPGPDGASKDIKDLSEGQVSLLFLALYATLFELDLALAEGEESPDGFKDGDLRAPALVIFAIEEPETHLSPFYLSRLVGLVKELATGHQAVAIVTSHSPSVLRRVEPDSVRYFRLCPTDLNTKVRAIPLPASGEEAEKFVRTAVLAHPEIYFSRLVVLGEGDSEASVLPLLARALGTELDPAFISFAPLSGRFVNHFWRLLDALEIPYVTLLDFDLGRFGAGPLRLKYAFDQLQKLSSSPQPDWLPVGTKKSAYWHSLDQAGVDRWIEWLETQGVFHSAPIDLDYLLMRSFPAAYGVPDEADRAEEVSDADAGDEADEADEADEEVDEAAVEKAVFGRKGRGLEAFDDLFNQDKPSISEMARYEDLFTRGSKPASHTLALSTLTATQLGHDAPQLLVRLFDSIRETLGLGVEVDD